MKNLSIRMVFIHTTLSSYPSHPRSIIIRSRFPFDEEETRENCKELRFLYQGILTIFSFFFLHLIFNVKFIFNYTERACRSTKETVIIRMKRVLGFNGEEADARSIRRTILPSLDPIIPYGYVGKEEFLKEFFFNEKSFSLSSSFFSRQIDRVGYDDEGDARDTGGPLRPRSQPLLGGRRQSATCCTNIVQGHRASAARG